MLTIFSWHKLWHLAVTYLTKQLRWRKLQRRYKILCFNCVARTTEDISKVLQQKWYLAQTFNDFFYWQVSTTNKQEQIVTSLLTSTGKTSKPVNKFTRYRIVKCEGLRQKHVSQMEKARGPSSPNSAFPCNIKYYVSLERQRISPIRRGCGERLDVPLKTIQIRLMCQRNDIENGGSHLPLQQTSCMNTKNITRCERTQFALFSTLNDMWRKREDLMTRHNITKASCFKNPIINLK